MTLLTMMLLPFLMSEHTSFLSSNAIAAMFNCALKVAVIAFLSSVGLSAMGRYFDELGKSFLTLQWQTMLGTVLQLCVTVFILTVLIWRVPRLVQSVLSGSPSMGASDMVQTIKSAVSTTTSVATVAAGGAGLAKGAAAAVGGNAGGQMMSAISNIGGALGDLKSGNFSGAFNKAKSAKDDTLGAAGTVGKIASTAVSNGLDSYMYNSAPRQMYANAIDVGKGNPRHLSDEEKAAGAVSKNMAGDAIHADGHTMSRDEVSKRAAAVRQAEGNSFIPGDETKQATRTATTEVNTQNTTKYNDTGAFEVNINVGGQNYTVSVKPTPPPKVPDNLGTFNP